MSHLIMLVVAYGVFPPPLIHFSNECVLLIMGQFTLTTKLKICSKLFHGHGTKICIPKISQTSLKYL